MLIKWEAATIPSVIQLLIKLVVHSLCCERVLSFDGNFLNINYKFCVCVSFYTTLLDIRLLANSISFNFDTLLIRIFVNYISGIPCKMWQMVTHFVSFRVLLLSWRAHRLRALWLYFRFCARIGDLLSWYEYSPWITYFLQ